MGVTLPRACLLLVAIVRGVWPAPQVSPEMTLMNQARQRMAANLASLPNYTCLEAIDRSVRRPAKQKLLFRDRIHLEVAFIEANEMFSWPGAGSFESDLLEQIPQVGASGAGGFGGWTRTLFGPSTPDFTYAGECMVDGRRGSKYTFRVPAKSSTYEVRSAGGIAMSPYSGSVCIDPGSLDIMLLEIITGQTPPPVASISESIHYGRARIGSADFLLPRDHELVVTDLEGNENRNLTSFTSCREYASQSSISFDMEHAAASGPQVKVEEVQIPPGVSMDLKLETPITFEESAVGDPITARFDRAIKAPGVSVPKGAIVSGRIRGLEQYFDPEKYFLVSLEFSSLTFDSKHAKFRAILLGPRLQAERHLDSSGMATETDVSTPGSAHSEPSGFDIDTSSPRFGVFRVRGGSLRLSRGLRMIWQTESETP
jgi:hypothetical protein